MVNKAWEFCGNLGEIVIELPGLLVAEASKIHSAALKCNDKRDETVLSVARGLDDAALRMHAYQAIYSAYPPNAPAFSLHRIDERFVCCRQRHGQCER